VHARLSRLQCMFGLALPSMCMLGRAVTWRVADGRRAAGRRYDFGQATCAGHGLAGEERFSVQWRRDDDSVWCRLPLTAHSNCGHAAESSLYASACSR